LSEFSIGLWRLNTVIALNRSREIIEYHVNYLDKQVTTVVGVWRTKAAYDNKRKFAAAITIPLAPDWAVKWLEKRQVETINLPQELQLLEAACLKLIEKQSKV
jgi:hypothetical protein